MNAKISIAMATYNGEKYLMEQLENFDAQTIKPHEVLITDDGSCDRTVPLIREFSRGAKFEVTLIENRERLGFKGNFEKAISLCLW